MKKTMFITSVIMVVVMAIALTTSSLAWFTAQGSPTVTTNTLSITATSQVSGGIKISVNRPDSTTMLPNTAKAYYDWEDAVSLASGNAVGSMKPLVPVMNADSVADDALEITSAQLLAALSAYQQGSTGGEDPQVTYTVKPNMVGNYTGTMGTYVQQTENQTTSDMKYTDGFFAKDVWITNIASGDSAAAVTIYPTITFPSYTYSSANDDAVIWVAVLGWTGTTGSNGADSQYWGENDANTSAWEIVALNASNPDLTAMNVGKRASDFDVGDSIAGSTTTLAVDNAARAAGTGWIKGGATGQIAAIAGDGTQSYKHFRIVAWYDGIKLYNNNSGCTVPFQVTFSTTNPNS